MHKISEISFKVLQDSALIDPERQTHITVKGQREHVWSLGLGPCGREVVELGYGITVAALTIKQVSCPKGFTEARDAAYADLKRPMSEYSRPDVKARRDRYEALVAESKTERFIYPLETIVSRIKVLES